MPYRIFLCPEFIDVTAFANETDTSSSEDLTDENKLSSNNSIVEDVVSNVKKDSKPITKTKTVIFGDDWQSQIRFAKVCERKECPECPAEEYQCSAQGSAISLGFGIGL